MRRSMRAVSFQGAFVQRAPREAGSYEGKPPRLAVRRCEEAVQVG